MIRIKEVIGTRPAIIALGEDSLIYYWSTTDIKWKIFDDNYFLINLNQNNQDEN